MSRWKPMKNEEYYYVQGTADLYEEAWYGGYIDERRFEVGNCFRTREEAQVAAGKMKKLLLSLHADKRLAEELPVLTTEVFDRPECPSWAQYAAVDSSGHASYYEKFPVRLRGFFFLSNVEGRSQMIEGHWYASHWENSVIARKIPVGCTPALTNIGVAAFKEEFNTQIIVAMIKELPVEQSKRIITTALENMKGENKRGKEC